MRPNDPVRVTAQFRYYYLGCNVFLCVPHFCPVFGNHQSNCALTFFESGKTLSQKIVQTFNPSIRAQVTLCLLLHLPRRSWKYVLNANWTGSQLEMVRSGTWIRMQRNGKTRPPRCRCSWGRKPTFPGLLGQLPIFPFSLWAFEDSSFK